MLDHINLQTAVSTLQMASSKITKEVTEELITKGYLDYYVMQKKRNLYLFGAIMMTLSALAIITLPFIRGLSSYALFMIPVGTFFSSFIIMIGTSLCKELTITGMEIASEWTDLVMGIRNSIKKKESLPTEYFDVLFPFVAVVGLGKPWTKHYAKQVEFVPPEWLQTMGGDDFEITFCSLLAVTAPTGATGTSGGSSGGAAGGGSSGAG